MAKRKVTAIPATINKFTAAPVNSRQKRKAAGYARVSTDHEDQVTSYAAQVDYYTNYIQGREDWEYAGIYTDDACIIGTNQSPSKWAAICPYFSFFSTIGGGTR